MIPVSGFWFYQDYLYVMDSAVSAARTNLTTGQIEDFLGDFNSITFIGDNCYYIEHGGRTFSVYEMDINTKEVNLLLGDGEYSLTGLNKLYYDGVRAVGENLYYTMRHEHKGTYLYNPDGEDTFLIPADDYSLEPFYTADYFYYSVWEENQDKLYEYSLKEKTSRLIATNDQFFRDLLITDSYIIFRPYENAELICLEY